MTGLRILHSSENKKNLKSFENILISSDLFSDFLNNLFEIAYLYMAARVVVYNAGYVLYLHVTQD